MTYLSKYRQIWRVFDRLESGLLKSSLDLLRKLQAGLSVEIRQGDTITAREMRDISARVNVLINLYESGMIELAQNGISKSFDLGLQSLIQPMATLGYTIAPLLVNREIVTVLKDLTVDQIVNISSEMRSRIITQIRITTLGQQNTLNAMQNINAILGVDARGRILTKRGGKRGITARAEAVFRTDTNRAFNMAHHAQQIEIAKTVDILKAWVATGDTRTRKSHLRAHRQYNDNPIPVDKPFIVGGVRMMHPHDPTAPAREVVNCRCREIAIPKGVELPPNDLDQRIKRQLVSRGM